MTVAFWCLFIACWLPIVTAWLCGWFRQRQFGHVDNKHPRAQYSQLQGPGARAFSAQQNAWEALAIFAPAVIVAHLSGVDQNKADLAACIFIAARLVYPVFYVWNKDVLRSLSFLVGFFSCVALFVMAA